MMDLMDLQGEFFQRLRTQGKSKNTLKNYKTDLDCFNHFIEKATSTRDVSKFNTSDIMDYGTHLENKYQSQNSRRRRVQALRMFFDFLVERSVFPNNPVRKIPTSPKFLDIPRPTPLVDTKTLWLYLLTEGKNGQNLMGLTAKRNQIITLLIFGGGLKVSDLAVLKREHIVLGDTPRVIVKPEKRDPYSVELPKVFNLAYQSYIETLEVCKRDSNIEFDDVLFSANPYKILSGGLSPRGLEIIFEDLRHKLMITLTPKSLRQGCIFKWLHQKRGETLIKEWMGVAPSYSLKLYREHMESHPYHDTFLEENYYDVNTNAVKPILN
jgi:site-specific recombinase XerD